MNRPFHPRQQAIEVGVAVEDRDRRERARQVRVLLEAPHQALCIAHLAIELRGLCHAITLRHDRSGLDARLPAEAAQRHHERADSPGEHDEGVARDDSGSTSERVEHRDHCLKQVSHREHDCDVSEK